MGFLQRILSHLVSIRHYISLFSAQRGRAALAVFQSQDGLSVRNARSFTKNYGKGKECRISVGLGYGARYGQ